MKSYSATQMKNFPEAASDFGGDAVAEISDALRKALADVFALYMKTKNFHWHMSGKHFRDYHLLLAEHATQIFKMTDDIAERARKIGRTTLHSISDISSHQRLKDNNAEFVTPEDMLAELRADNQNVTRSLRSIYELCERHGDVATASLIENWINESERGNWFLSKIVSERLAAVEEEIRRSLTSSSAAYISPQEVRVGGAYRNASPFSDDSGLLN
jgi:starvation-inducible DNA-binding protein